jgi:phage FluMu protein Com
MAIKTYSQMGLEKVIDTFIGAGTEQQKQRVDAEWSAFLYAICPYCKRHVNLIETDEWRGDWAYRFGKLENRKNVNAEVTCPFCKLLFVVGDVKW